MSAHLEGLRDGRGDRSGMFQHELRCGKRAGHKRPAGGCAPAPGSNVGLGDHCPITASSSADRGPSRRSRAAIVDSRAALSWHVVRFNATVTSSGHPQPPGGGALGPHRAQQAAWREHLGWPPGPPTHKGAQARYETVPFCLAREHGGRTAREAGINLMSDDAISYAKTRGEALGPIGGLAEEDRLWRNMLSSQPLAFSIAGELRRHPDAAAALFTELIGDKVASLEPLVDPRFPAYALHGIEAEWFPPRKLHTQDRSGFDIAALVRLADDRRMLVTIEVKYTDSFSSKKLDPDRQPYPAHLTALGLEQDQTRGLIDSGGSQLLRSVLLTDSVRRHGIAGEANGGQGTGRALAVVLARADDSSARRVTDRFAKLDLPTATDLWTHTAFLDAAGHQPALADWAERMQTRYLPEARRAQP